MGILNLTPDSFSDGGKFHTLEKALFQVEKMLSEGANIIDIGGYSTRPNAENISAEQELDRIYDITTTLLKTFPSAIFSVDTFRSVVADEMLKLGVHLINDISGGTDDAKMFDVVAKYDAPYILMHKQGTPQTMQINPHYENVVEEIWQFFVTQVSKARAAGIKDVVLDVGFGFGKTMAHNYELVNALQRFRLLNLPILMGISRKSMLYKLFGILPNEVLSLATALHLQGLQAGAKILRVHDVKEAVQVVKVYEMLQNA
jgi:dihydropteroate synthase